jgi:hypothetical protein
MLTGQFMQHLWGSAGKTGVDMGKSGFLLFLIYSGKMTGCML